jgi:hypothetical protein
MYVVNQDRALMDMLYNLLGAVAKGAIHSKKALTAALVAATEQVSYKDHRCPDQGTDRCYGMYPGGQGSDCCVCAQCAKRVPRCCMQ